MISWLRKNQILWVQNWTVESCLGGIWSSRACGISKLTSSKLSSTSSRKTTHKSNVSTLSGFSSAVKNYLLVVGSCHQLRYSCDTCAMWYCDLQSAKTVVFSCIFCVSLRWCDELIASSSALIVVYFEIFRFSLSSLSGRHWNEGWLTNLCEA